MLLNKIIILLNFMNLPATKRLMRREMTKIINKLLVVIPKIPEEGYRKSQEAILSDIEKKYTTVASNEDELKRLCIFASSFI